MTLVETAVDNNILVAGYEYRSVLRLRCFRQQV